MSSTFTSPTAKLFAILLTCMAFVSNAKAFDIKGLGPGQRLEELRKLVPQLQCKSWLSGPYEQMCDGEGLSGKLSTLADYPVVSIRAMADKHDITHVVIFSVSCGIQTEQLAAALKRKWGTPSTIDKLNHTFQWQNKNGEVLRLLPANGKDNVCNMVDVEDAEAVKWHTPKPVKPSKDL